MNANELIQEAGKSAKAQESRREEKAKKLLLKSSLSLVGLADELDCAPKAAKQIVAKLKAGGYNVHVTDEGLQIRNTLPQNQRLVVNSADFYDGEWARFGLLGDTHLCSRYARMDVLNSLYDIYEREGIKKVYHTGNIVDGEARFNKHDLVTRAGMDAQVEYTIEEYPQRKGIVTHFITGDDHEGWYLQREGVNFGQYLQSRAEKDGRGDLQWIGHVEVDITLKAKSGSAWMRVAHPGGGSSYAISYAGQKIVESYQGGEKPRILLIGHYHKFNVDYSREVHIVQTGCTEDQTIFMRKKKLQAHVGGSILDFHQSPTGEINRFRVEWMPYYDRSFYTRGDKYRMW